MTDLSSSYEHAVSLWLRLLPSHPQMSAPQLVHPTDAYRQTRTRLMIVGQETLGWGDNGSVPRDQSVPDICAALRQGYRDFNLGGGYGHTPFWSASNRLFHALNGLGKVTSLYLYPFEDHGPATRETLLDLWARWTAWLGKYLDARPAPGKPVS